MITATLTARLATRLPRFRRNLWLFLLSCVFVFVSMGVQSLVLNLYFAEIGFREDFMGLFSFANTAGIGLSAVLAGRASNRLGPRRVLLVAVAVLAASSVGLVFTVNALALLVIGVINGISLANIFVPCATFVMDNAEPGQRATAYAGYFAAQSIAQVIGSYVGGVMPSAALGTPVATGQGYAVTLVVAGILAGVGFFPLLLTDDHKVEGSQQFIAEVETPTAEHRRRARRDLRWLLASNAFIAGAIGVVIPFFNIFFREKHGATTEEIGYIFALGSMAMVVSSIIGPGVGKRLGIVPAVVLGRGLTAPLFFALILSPTLATSSFLYVSRILFNNLTWPIDNAFSMELVPADMRATLAALRTTSWNLAWAVASGLAGAMIVQFGFPSIFLISGVLTLCGTTIYFLAFRSRIAPVGLPKALATPAPDG